METWDAITARRNVREFADRPIPAADLERILEAGRIAPSSQNNQPWDFVLVTEPGQLQELSTRRRPYRRRDGRNRRGNP